MQYDRWIDQFMIWSGYDSLKDLLNIDTNTEIEFLVFTWIQEQRQIYTESTVMQKTAALISFYYVHDIPFLSDRILDEFPNYPIYFDTYKIDLIYEK